MDVTSGPDAAFYQFCDALEVKDGQTAPESGWGLDHALTAWGAYFQNVTLPIRQWSICYILQVRVTET